MLQSTGRVMVSTGGRTSSRSLAVGWRCAGRDGSPASSTAWASTSPAPPAPGPAPPAVSAERATPSSPLLDHTVSHRRHPLRIRRAPASAGEVVVTESACRSGRHRAAMATRFAGGQGAQAIAQFVGDGGDQRVDLVGRLTLRHDRGPAGEPQNSDLLDISVLGLRGRGGLPGQDLAGRRFGIDEIGLAAVAHCRRGLELSPSSGPATSIEVRAPVGATQVRLALGQCTPRRHGRGSAVGNPRARAAGPC